MIKSRRTIIVLLTGLNLLNYVDRYIVAAVLPKILAPHADGGLAISAAQAGFLPVAFLIGYFVTSPIFGARADKGARRGLIALGVAVWSLATAATGFAHSFAMLIATRAIVGVGEASYATLAPTIIDDLTPPAQKGRALSIFYLAMPIGSALGYLTGGFIEPRWGWRGAFFIAGGPGLLLALTCLLIAEPERKLREAKGKVLDGLKTLSRLPLFRRAVIGYCAYTAAIGAFAFWAPTFIVGQFKTLTLETANYYFGLVTVAAGAIGTIIGGQWADRAQRAGDLTNETPFDAPANRANINVLLKVCAIGVAVAVPLVALAFLVPSAAAFFGLAFVAEIGLFLSTSPVNAIGLRAVPPELRASAMAAMIFAIHLLGDLWSPPVLGLLLDRFPSQIAMMALPVTFAVAAAVWWPRKREAV